MSHFLLIPPCIESLLVLGARSLATTQLNARSRSIDDVLAGMNGVTKLVCAPRAGRWPLVVGRFPQNPQLPETTDERMNDVVITLFAAKRPNKRVKGNKDEKGRH